MDRFTRCSNCMKQLVEVPLRDEGRSMVCPFCESIYEKILPKK